MLPALLPYYSLDYLRWQLLDQPFLFYIFSCVCVYVCVFIKLHTTAQSDPVILFNSRCTCVRGCVVFDQGVGQSRKRKTSVAHGQSETRAKAIPRHREKEALRHIKKLRLSEAL